MRFSSSHEPELLLSMTNSITDTETTHHSKHLWGQSVFNIDIMIPSNKVTGTFYYSFEISKAIDLYKYVFAKAYEKW